MSVKHQAIRGLDTVMLFAVALLCLSVASTAYAATSIASITLTVPSKSLKIGKKETLKATAKDSKGKAISGVKFTWSASKASVAKVSAGVVTAVKAGSSVIKATSGGKSATVTITVPTTTGATGVAAKGAAIAGATITLVDKNGKTVSTTTGSDGSYTLDTTGLTSPFLVRLVFDTTTLYSVSDATTVAKTINVTPLTDLIIRSWYSVQGKTIDTAFAHPGANPAPTPTEVQVISNVVVQVTALWLQQAGVDTTNFSPISTPFVADSTGVDAVLDDTSIDTGTGVITITDGGAISQSSTVSYDTGSGSISVDTTTTDSDTGTTGSSVQGTVVATTTTMQTALTGITTTLTNFANTINAKGTALANTDLTPFLDTNLLDEGLNKAQFADSTADQFRGLTLSFQILNINSLDTASGLADVSFTASESLGDQSQTETAEFFFKKQSDGSWFFFGDQMPAKLGVQAEMRTNQGFISGDNGPDINVDIRPIKGAYTGITIDDGGLGIFTGTALTQGGTDAKVFTPNPAKPGTTVEVDYDEFLANSGVLKDLVPAGTPMTITMTPKTGIAKQYVVKTNALTTESISITNLTGTSLTTDGHPGTPLHVEWTLPISFAIAEVKISVIVFDGDQTLGTTNSCNPDETILAITDTSADVTIPTTVCGSNGTTVQANINLGVTGVNGERETVIYSYSDPLP